MKGSQVFLLTLSMFGLMLYLGLFDDVFSSLVVASPTSETTYSNMFLELKPYSLLISSIPFGIFLIQQLHIFDSHHIEWKEPIPSYFQGSHEPNTETTIDDILSLKSENSLELLKCPNCSAPLDFESNNVTICGYCNSRVKLKSEA